MPAVHWEPPAVGQRRKGVLHVSSNPRWYVNLHCNWPYWKRIFELEIQRWCNESR